jgi:hypothetical protein
MVIKRFGAAALSLFCTLSLAASLVTYSPITCGCIDPWITIGQGVSGTVPATPDVLTASFIRENLDVKFKGKKVTANDLPFATSTYDCAASSPPAHLIRCRWWLWEAQDRRKGFDVSIETDATGIFRSAEVVEIEHVDRWASQ